MGTMLRLLSALLLLPSLAVAQLVNDTGAVAVGNTLRKGVPGPSTGCDCGSTNAAAPCTGTQISLTRQGTDASYTTTFSFSCAGGACKCGRFANGWDYWVAPATNGGTVALTAVTPTPTGAADSTLRNGWVVNPSSPYSTGMDGRLGGTGAGTPLVPSPASPYSINTSSAAITSIVKGTSRNPSAACGTSLNGIIRFCFDQIEVLTVLNSAPAGAGTAVLRPGYFGTANKSLVNVSDINFAALPARAAPVTPSGTKVLVGTPSQALEYLKGFKIDWVLQWPSIESFKATSSFPGTSSAYSPGPWGLYWQYASWALLNSGEITTVDRNAIATWIIQHGLDVLTIRKNYPLGHGPWVPNGGHGVGRYGTAVLAAALVNDGGDNSALITTAYNTGIGRQIWAETGQIQNWTDTGKITYGAETVPGGESYTDCTSNTNSILADPLHLADNGDIRFVGTGCSAGLEAAYQAIAAPLAMSQYAFLDQVPATAALVWAPGKAYVTRLTTLGVMGEGPTYENIMPRCAGGLDAGMVCTLNAHCPGSSCDNRRTNWSNGTYFSRAGMLMWEGR